MKPPVQFNNRFTKTLVDVELDANRLSPIHLTNVYKTFFSDHTYACSLPLNSGNEIPKRRQGFIAREYVI